MSSPFRYISGGAKAAVDAVTSRFVSLLGGTKDKNWHNRSMLRVPLSDATAAGGSAASVANPFGRAVMIGRVIVNRTAGTTGTLDIGVAANGTTSSDILLDGAAATATIFDNINDAGTNGKSRQRWAATEFVTATPSATPTGLVGFMYIEIIDP